MATPAGKRLAPMLAELVLLLRHHRELDIDDQVAALLIGMSAATIDRSLVAAKSPASSRWIWSVMRVATLPVGSVSP